MIKKILINIKSNKFSKDVLITLTSNIAVGISGVLFNTIIGNLYSIYNLGIFNQALSAYLFLGIIANLGIRNAILKFCAETNNHYKHQKAILGSGLIIVLVSSILISSAIYLTTKQFPEILFNKEATSVFQYFIYSIPFFCLNKVFLFFFNAKRQMKTFSFYSFLRVFLSKYTHQPMYFLCENRFGQENYMQEQCMSFINFLNENKLNYHLEIIPKEGHSKNRKLSEVKQLFQKYCMDDSN